MDTVPTVTTDLRSRTAAFTAFDWALLLVVGVMWGGSFLLIKIAVADFVPETVAWMRLVFGAGFLGLLPAARSRMVHRGDWWLVAALAVTWMAIPFVLFSIAEQSIDSALAGMINGAAPLCTAVIAAVWFRNRPSRTVTIGLVIGFFGVLAVTAPSAGGQSSMVGICLILAAVVLYGIAFNMSDPLQARNGALPVILRAELVALVVSTPAGAIGLAHSTPTVGGWAALAILGVVSTGVAFACFTTLIGRVGAPRASVATYLIPGVAIVLGALINHETVHLIALVGIVFILTGAYLTSRKDHEHERPGPRMATASASTR